MISSHFSKARGAARRHRAMALAGREGLLSLYAGEQPLVTVLAQKNSLPLSLLTKNDQSGTILLTEKDGVISAMCRREGVAASDVWRWTGQPPRQTKLEKRSPRARALALRMTRTDRDVY